MKAGFALEIFIIALCMGAIVKAGPYNEPGINGYVGPNTINPIFRGWARAVANYAPAPGVGDNWKNPAKALGPATGDIYDIVSLGDLSQAQINQGIPAGRITLIFGDPCLPNDPNHIRNGKGYDFAVFENGFASGSTNPYYGYVAGKIFAELGYVEVSSNGVNFARFPSVSLTSGRVGFYGTVDITDIYNLAGKHPNGYGLCMGTPFDLSELEVDPNVLNGSVDLNNISYVRIIDIPGSGDFKDNATEYVDPCSRPNWDYYDANHPIYDSWPTTDSGGFDLEAIGVLRPQQYRGDINLDGVVNFADFAILAGAWQKQFGQTGWIARCEISDPENLVVDISDFATLAEDWLKVEQWHRN